MKSKKKTGGNYVFFKDYRRFNFKKNAEQASFHKKVQ